ncbi:MAG: segregation/condensation protein A [Gemmatimonadota bacterium]|nr:MAG: segregation/condensation protein A [Gemmatimonadota bacterium]
MSISAIVEPERPFVVELEEFSGPLDLLLHLIREQEIDITDIPIAQIAHQFLHAIDALGLDEAANYLEMAAWLLRIKIQMLLPRPFDEENWEDPRAELVRRLLEYEQVREVARWLEGQADLRSGQFSRGWVPEAPEQEPSPIVLDLGQILAAVDRVLESIPQPVLHRVVPRPLDVEGATRRILDLLESSRELDFLDVIGPEPTVADVLSALMALLELARVGRVRLMQPKPFSSMAIAGESTHPTD